MVSGILFSVAISHVCMSCGLDLARQRVRVEPHYHLPIVTCPRCNWTCVRRRHPIQARWRAFLRAFASIRAMILQVFAGAILAVTTIGISGWLADVLHTLPIYGFQNYDIRFPLVSALCCAIATGVWLTAAFGHWKPIPRWFCWWGLIVGLVSIEPLWNLSEPARAAMGFDTTPVRIDLQQWRDQLVLVVALAIVAIIGVPLGQAARRSHRKYRANKFRKRLAQRRKRRLA